MGKCAYFSEDNSGSYCLSDKHPKYTKKNGRGSATVASPYSYAPPRCIKEDGKGCPFYKK